MRTLRFLACLLVGVGLFIQAAAYAAPRLDAPAPVSVHCQEMGEQLESSTGEREEGRCDDMRLDCLVSMNCVSPLFLPVQTAIGSLAGAREDLFTHREFGRLASSSRGPEPPPPELNA